MLGRYVDLPRTGRVLDVGFGSGAELMLFARMGLEAHGLEVDEEIVIGARQRAADAGLTMNLGVMTGTELPYPDGHFDLVLSWNAVYYHGSRTAVAAAIGEFRRVLRRDGVLLMSVIHPRSWIVPRLGSRRADGTHPIEEHSAHDNRRGIEIFYDGRVSTWRRLLTGFDVEEGYVETNLFAPALRDAARLFLARKNGQR